VADEEDLEEAFEEMAGAPRKPRSARDTTSYY